MSMLTSHELRATNHERRIWLTCSMASPQVPGPAQDNAYKLALSWGILGHSGPSGVATPTPNARTKVRIFADEEKRDAIVHAFEVSLGLVIDEARCLNNYCLSSVTARLLRIRYGSPPHVCYLKMKSIPCCFYRTRFLRLGRVPSRLTYWYKPYYARVSRPGESQRRYRLHHR